MIGGHGGRSLVVVGCTLAALLAGCGGSSQSTTTRASTAATRASATTAAGDSQTPATAGDAASQIGPDHPFTPNPSSEPAAPKAHPGARVDHVIVRELKRGRGPAIRPGATVWADYIESNYTTGHKFMRAWGRGRTENMVLAPGAWMAGLIRGMTGMRAGERRTIIVPAKLSDIHDSDRAGNSYKQIVYFDIVLRRIDALGGR